LASAAAAAAEAAMAANIVVFSDRAFGGELAQLYPPPQTEISLIKLIKERGREEILRFFYFMTTK